MACRSLLDGIASLADGCTQSRQNFTIAWGDGIDPVGDEYNEYRDTSDLVSVRRWQDRGLLQSEVIVLIDLPRPGTNRELRPLLCRYEQGTGVVEHDLSLTGPDI